MPWDDIRDHYNNSVVDGRPHRSTDGLLTKWKKLGLEAKKEARRKRRRQNPLTKEPRAPMSTMDVQRRPGLHDWPCHHEAGPMAFSAAPMFSFCSTSGTVPWTTLPSWEEPLVSYQPSLM
jgi:hypothetical protein